MSASKVIHLRHRILPAGCSGWALGIYHFAHHDYGAPGPRLTRQGRGFGTGAGNGSKHSTKTTVKTRRGGRVFHVKHEAVVAANRELAAAMRDPLCFFVGHKEPA